MAEKRIKGAIGINGIVYGAGQEAEMEAAAKAAGVDLSDERFAENALEGYQRSAPKPAEAEGAATGEGDSAPRTSPKGAARKSNR